MEKENMNKKGSSTVWIISGVVLIFAILVIVTIIIANSGRDKNSIDEYLNVYVNSVDSETGEQLNSEYLIADNEGIIYKQGTLDKTSLVQIKDIPKEKEITVYCWGGNHYFSKIEHNFTNIEKLSNSSKITCKQDSIGDLDITHEGNLDNVNNQIIFKIKTDKHFKDLSAVLIWSSGIINVNFGEPKVTCANWSNSSYNLKLTENNYLCEGKVYVCEKVEGNDCILKQETPQRFIQNTDKIISTGKSLSNEIYELTIDVKTEEIKNQNDYLEVVFYDQDLVYLGDKWSLLSEYQDKNLGNLKDFSYKVEYEI